MLVLKEFRDFAAKGSMVEMAVGVVFGIALGRVVSSIATDLIMPVVGSVLGGVSAKSLYIDLSNGGYATMEAAEAAGAPLLRYGQFLSSVLDLMIVCMVLFVIVRVANRIRA